VPGSPRSRRAALLSRTDVALRRGLARLSTERRAVPLLAILLLAVASLLSQVPATAAGGTGGTDGPGAAYNPRIAAINIDGPDTGQVDPGLQAAAGLQGTGGATAPQASSSSTAVDVGAYTMVDGSLIKPISADSTVADISGEVRTYTVQSGDTLSGIADRFGLSMMTIWWANRLTSADTLHVGQKLLIPPVNGVLYKAQPGDTAITIARKFHASASEVRAFNALTGDTVVIGQELMVPDGQGAPIATPTPAPTPASAPSGTASASGGAAQAQSNGAVGGPCTTCSYGGSMVWPVPGGFISQYYWWGHPALDIAAAYGTPVLAAAPGVVTFAGWRDNGGGYQVWMSHGNNVYTTYNHMSAVLVAVGQHLAAGQQLGRIGATGDATGPHCHFEVWIGPIWDGGTRVNPLNYLSH
jgi:murein DD-endopeptidase MepM/ murein hydrolase activator NlpD